MIRKILSLTVLFFLTSYTLAEPLRYCTAQENSQDPEISYEEAIRRLDLFMQKIEELRSHIDRSQFDLEALLDKIGYEAEDIIRFVKEEIAFEQYPGLLRGAQGTLMSRAGNALDQSVLLATLLKDAGYEARIVRGFLRPADAHLLLASMFSVNRTPSVASMKDAEVAEVLRQLANIAGVSPEFLLSLWNKSAASIEIDSTPEFLKTQSDAGLITNELTKAGVPLRNRDLTEALVQEANDYYWTEFRLGPTDRWLASHPALAGTFPEAQATVRKEVFSDSIPDKLTHRLRFRVYLERKVGDRMVLQEVIPEWERPVADLLGKSLSYINLPNTISTLRDFADLEIALSRADFYLPVFSETRNQKPFDLTGQILPLEALTAAGGLFKLVGARFHSALDLLAQLDTEEKSPSARDNVSVASQWIEYSIVAPDGETETFRRSVFTSSDGDRNAQSENQASHEIRLLNTPLSRFQFMIAVGEYPPSFVLDRILEQVLSQRTVLEPLLRRSDPLQGAHAGFADLGIDLLRLFTMFEAYRDNSGLSYRNEPALIVAEHRIQPEVNQLVIDIVSSRHRTFRLENGRLLTFPKKNVAKGIWETRAEDALHSPYAERVFSVPMLFDRLSPDSAIAVVSSEAELEALDYPPDFAAEISEEIRNGSVVLVPNSEGPAVRGYWSVNRESGATIGRGFGGRGVSLSQYLIVMGAGITIGIFAVTIPCLILVARVLSVSDCTAVTACGVLGLELGGTLAPTAAGVPVAGLGLAIGFVFASFAMGLFIAAVCEG